MIIKKIIELLDEWAPKAYAEDFDNVGLLIGNDKEECKGVLVSFRLYRKSSRGSD